MFLNVLYISNSIEDTTTHKYIKQLLKITIIISKGY